jgi:hypothetical protein
VPGQYVLLIVEQLFEENILILLAHHTNSCQVLYSMIEAVESVQAGAHNKRLDE